MKLTANYASTTALSVNGNAYFPGSGIWNSSGNVGIGTTSPQYALTVSRSGADASANLAALKLNTSDSLDGSFAVLAY
jgi:hypothetical protein